MQKFRNAADAYCKTKAEKYLGELLRFLFFFFPPAGGGGGGVVE